VVLNGRVVAFDVTPTVQNGRMLAGFRSLFTNTGARVSWIAESRTARSVSGGLTVEIPIGSTIAKVNATTVDMGMPATIEQGRTIVPLRFFAEVTGASLHWDKRTRTAMLDTRTRAVAKRPETH
jgi:hypothetical protein